MFQENQFDFRSKRITINALAQITKQIGRGKTEKFTCILLDLPKAFGSINHGIFVAKLEKSGVRAVCLKWFESFLSEIFPCVQVNDVLSTFLYLLKGVPQGLVNGHLLCSKHIIHPPSACDFLDPTFFADDTILVIVKVRMSCFC